MNKINLLPEEYKKSIAQAKENSRLLSYIGKSALPIIFIAIIFAAMLTYLGVMQNTTNQAYIEKEKEASSFGNLEEKAKKEAERLKNIKSITKSAPNWSNVIEEIQKIMPAGVSLSSLKMDSATKNRNQLNGTALSKKEVADLRDLMEKSEKFEYVDIETSSTVNDPDTKRDIESFNLSFSLSEGALK